MTARPRCLRGRMQAGGFAAALLFSGAAHAASPTDMGSWGQAWGDDTQAAPPATTAPRQTGPAPTAPAIVTPAPVLAAPLPARSAPGPADMGNWSDAWGDDTAPARPAAANSAPPAAPSPVVAAPVAAPVMVTTPTVTAAPVAAPPAPAPPPRAAPLDASVPATTRTGNQPVGLTADQVVYDRDYGIVTARGRVEIVQGNRTLVADSVSYNLKQDIIAASGNVITTDATGAVSFADYFELTGDFKQGVASQIRMVMADNSLLTGQTAQRVAGNRTDLDHATYTACANCLREPGKTPSWQVRAAQVTHDQEEREIIYHDAWLEVAGVPVMYTPYLSHPDPSQRRKSGFLIPSAGMSSTLGASVTVPYFWTIGDNQDLTLSPRIFFPEIGGKDNNNGVEANGYSPAQRVMLVGQHNWAGMAGETATSASLTRDHFTDKVRGHIDATGRFDLTNRWRAGYQLQRSSDDTYTTLYSIPMANNQPWLTSRPYVEGFGRRDYAVVEGFSFQGLRTTDDPAQAPLVLPHATYSHVGAPDAHGAYWTVDGDTLSYAREDGVSANRLSSEAAWHRPFTGSWGDITELTASLRGDAYHADHMDDDIGSAASGRVVPQVAVNWRQPYFRPSRSMPQIIEPLLMVAVSPNGGNPKEIPNEDSRYFELDEINVMQANRMVGLDRVEGGLRGGYGVRWSAYPAGGSYINLMAAQGWRARRDSTFGEGQGFDDYLSDYVGRVDFVPSRNLSFLNRVRLDKDTLDLRRDENTISIGSPLLRSSITYIFLDRSGSGNDTFDRRHSVNYTLSSQLTQSWSATGTISQNLIDGSHILSWNGRLTYADDCMLFATVLSRSLTEEEDASSGYQLTFNIIFKTLGDVPLNIF